MKSEYYSSLCLNNRKLFNLFKYFVLIFFFLFVGFIGGNEKVEAEDTSPIITIVSVTTDNPLNNTHVNKYHTITVVVNVSESVVYDSNGFQQFVDESEDAILLNLKSNMSNMCISIVRKEYTKDTEINATYEYSSCTKDGDLDISVDANIIRDSDNNFNGAASGTNITIDNVAPRIRVYNLYVHMNGERLFQHFSESVNKSVNKDVNMNFAVLADRGLFESYDLEKIKVVYKNTNGEVVENMCTIRDRDPSYREDENNSNGDVQIVLSNCTGDGSVEVVVEEGLFVDSANNKSLSLSESFIVDNTKDIPIVSVSDTNKKSYKWGDTINVEVTLNEGFYEETRTNVTTVYPKLKWCITTSGVCTSTNVATHRVEASDNNHLYYDILVEEGVVGKLVIEGFDYQVGENEYPIVDLACNVADYDNFTNNIGDIGVFAITSISMDTYVENMKYATSFATYNLASATSIKYSKYLYIQYTVNFTTYYSGSVTSTSCSDFSVDMSKLTISNYEYNTNNITCSASSLSTNLVSVTMMIQVGRLNKGSTITNGTYSLVLSEGFIVNSKDSVDINVIDLIESNVDINNYYVNLNGTNYYKAEIDGTYTKIRYFSAHETTVFYKENGIEYGSFSGEKQCEVFSLDNNTTCVYDATYTGASNLFYIIKRNETDATSSFRLTLKASLYNEYGVPLDDDNSIIVSNFSNFDDEYVEVVDNGVANSTVGNIIKGESTIDEYYLETVKYYYYVDISSIDNNKSLGYKLHTTNSFNRMNSKLNGSNSKYCNSYQSTICKYSDYNPEYTFEDFASDSNVAIIQHEAALDSNMIKIIKIYVVKYDSSKVSFDFVSCNGDGEVSSGSICYYDVIN